MYRRSILIFIVLLLGASNLFAQNKLAVFSNGGYSNHLTREGLNLELGADYEILKHLDVSLALRHNALYTYNSQVIIQNTALYVSWIIVNRNAHRLMIGPGICYGNYYRNDPEGIFKQYDSPCLHPIRIQYDYTIKDKFKFGTILGMYGDDGDGTNYIGLMLGYRLR